MGRGWSQETQSDHITLAPRSAEPVSHLLGSDGSVGRKKESQRTTARGRMKHPGGKPLGLHRGVGVPWSQAGGAFRRAWPIRFVLELERHRAIKTGLQMGAAPVRAEYLAQPLDDAPAQVERFRTRA